MKFALFWSSPRISWAIQTNKFLSGEFHAFRGKMIIIGFGRCHGNLAVNKAEQDEICTIHGYGYLYIKYRLGCFLVR